jgi:site-specific recombinase XerD
VCYSRILPGPTDTPATNQLGGPVGLQLRNAVHAYLAARSGEVAPGTLTQWRSILVLAATEIGSTLLVSRLRRHHVEAWLASINHLAASTRRNRLATFRGFTSWAVDSRHLKLDPCHGLKVRGAIDAIPRELEPATVTKLLLATPDLRGEVVVLLGVHQGLRRAEIAGALRENLSLDDGLLLVLGKGNKERWVAIGPETHTALVAYLATVPGRTGPILRSHADPSQGISASHVGHLAGQWMRAAGIKRHAYDGMSLHALRATMAGAMLDDGADPRDVRDALGHQSIQTTEVYLRKRRAKARLREVMGQRSYRP